MVFIASVAPPDPAAIAWFSLWASAWMWVPLVFGAYAIGHKQFGLKSILVFITVESVAIFWFTLLNS